MVPLREARRVNPVTPTCNFVARKVRPNTDLTFRICARTTPALLLNLQRGKWLHTSEVFINTTKGLVVMAFKLCQEGNGQPFGSTNRFRKRIV
jgi:hypothetical protein